MGLSQLNAHLFEIHSRKTDSPFCSCTHSFERFKAFRPSLPLYCDTRTQMTRDTLLIVPNFFNLSQDEQLNIYLRGNNLNEHDQRRIANIFQKFILHTKRFSF